MKKLTIFLSTLLMILSVSCGGNSVNINEENLSPRERDALRYVKKHLERGEKLMDIQFVTGAMPIELMSDEFKRYRDEIYKAGLDYNSCKTRGIDVGMEKAAGKIAAVQEEIQLKENTWNAEQGTSEYLFALTTSETSSMHGGRAPKKTIWVFNPKTPEHDFSVILTKPVVNNALMILNAVNGTLFDYATSPESNLESLKSSVKNPVVSFILNADPTEVR